MSEEESESWSNSEGTQVKGIGRSGRDVVVLQEIKPKVHLLILQGLYTYMMSPPLNSDTRVGSKP